MPHFQAAAAAPPRGRRLHLVRRALRHGAPWLVALALMGVCEEQIHADEPTPPPPADAVADEAAGDDTPGDPAVDGESASEEELGGDATPPAPEDAGDEASPCGIALREDSTWVDWLQANVYRSVCSSALWFDDFFGDERIEVERGDNHGRLGVLAFWDDRDGFDLDTRFHAKLALPRADRRLHAVFGRADPDDFARSDTEDRIALPEAFRDTEKEWLAGLAYRPVYGKRHSLELDGGIKVDFPMDPYVIGRYRFQSAVEHSWLLRTEVTPFWRNSKQFGSTARFTLDHSLVPTKAIIRFDGGGTVSQEDEGLEWWMGTTIYQYISPRRAIAYRVSWRGETDADIPVNDYGVEVIYRQRVHRDWLYLETRGLLAWRREELYEERELVPRLGFGFEMRFGNER